MADGPLTGRVIGVLTANEGVEQVELTEPWKAIEAAGGRPVLIAPEAGEVQAFDHLDKADTFPVDRTISQVAPEDIDGLVLPGGVANPDQLRTVPQAVAFVRRVAERGTPIAAICHAPWTLIDAGLVSGRTLTSWPSLSTDLTNAGAEWVDEEVVVCTAGPDVMVTSRNPGDLPAFCRALVDQFSTVPAGRS
jgi:protease I